jgi:hypothetical protein
MKLIAYPYLVPKLRMCMWTCYFCPLYGLMAWYLIKHRNKLQQLPASGIALRLKASLWLA